MLFDKDLARQKFLRDNPTFRAFKESSQEEIEHHKKTAALAAKTHRIKNPLKVRARKLIYTGLRNGSITRQQCVICGIMKAEAHHEDYDKPYDITWFCRKHHLEHHKEKDTH